MTMDYGLIGDRVDADKVVKKEWTEKNFQSHIEKQAKIHGWLYYHTHRSDRSVKGFPDLVLVRDDRLMFWELKIDEKRSKVTPHQQQWLDALAATGAETAVYRPSDIEEMLEKLA